MGPKREKVVVAMSGGVDSSVAAALLVEQGYEVMGLFMRVGVEVPEAADDDGREEPARVRRGCCSARDAEDARSVAGLLDIPFYALNFEEYFGQLIDYFVDEYVRGRTPNPCVICNDRLKFGKLVDYANAVGAGYVATGHYARIARRDDNHVLMRGRDDRKDQSYVLFGLDRKMLGRVIFPLGELTKSEVRGIAARLGLPNRDKADSVEICFAPDRDYTGVIRQRRPNAFVAGDVIDTSGQVIGRHTGLCRYTIGQRRGLGIAAGTPIYVTKLDLATNRVTVGGADALLCPALLADRCSFLVDPPEGPFRAEVKIRYLHRSAPGTVYPLGNGEVRVVFDAPQRAITPGQAVVLYDGDVVVGGGWIKRSAAEPEGPGEGSRPAANRVNPM